MDRETIQDRFGIIGNSSAIKHVIDQIRLVARTDVTVLIQGESGVGKELVARAIHELSGRKHNALVTVNCGAIPETLLESELFGTEKGAYTGAVERRAGYFETADTGTIFLDEIGEMPLAAQVRLLRVLETGHFSRVGSSVEKRTDVRIIAATNKDLPREVQNGGFREDLYYRLSTVIIHIPPLRHRRDDVIPIFDTFLHQLSQQYNTPMKKLDDDARELLLQYRWPGNVRELRNVAERLTVMQIEPSVNSEGLRQHLRGISASGEAAAGLVPADRESAGSPMGSRERELIYRALMELRMDIAELKQGMQILLGNSAGATRRPMLSAHEEEIGERAYEPPDDFIEDVPFEIENESPVTEPQRTPQNIFTDELPTLDSAERELISAALEKFNGNRRQTARALGISERTLYRKIKEMEDAAAS